MTLRDQIVAARARLIAAHLPSDEAARDAAVLARHALGWDAAALLARDREPSPDGFAAAFDPLIARRARREPVAHIRGVQEFWEREFVVSPSVLIPRPETELIIDEALERAGAGLVLKDVCDVGTGSGCLAVTLAAQLPDSRIVATDVSPAALEVARINAERHRVSHRIDFRLGSYFAGASGPFDMVVCNPPYIAERDHQSLPPEVRDFEPAEALKAGSDGLRDIRELVQLAQLLLRDDGLLIFEMGYDQSARVTSLVSRTPGLRFLHVRADLQGHARVAVVRRTARILSK